MSQNQTCLNLAMRRRDRSTTSQKAWKMYRRIQNSDWKDQRSAITTEAALERGGLHSTSTNFDYFVLVWPRLTCDHVGFHRICCLRQSESLLLLLQKQMVFRQSSQVFQILLLNLADCRATKNHKTQQALDARHRLRWDNSAPICRYSPTRC